MKRTKAKAKRCSARPLLVAIVGGSGSGKSWLADRLETALAPNATRLSLDDFYRDRSHLSPRRRARLNFDHPRAIDWLAVERALSALLAGRCARVPIYNFKTHCRQRRSKRLAPKSVIVMDGLWFLWKPSLRRRFALRIFLDCPTRIRLSRRLRRDLQARGRSAESVRHQFRTTVQPMHLRYVAPQRRWADIVLRGTHRRSDLRRIREILNRPRNLGIQLRFEHSLIWRQIKLGHENGDTG